MAPIPRRHKRKRTPIKTEVKPPPKRRRYSVVSVSRAGHKTLRPSAGTGRKTLSARPAQRSGRRRSSRRAGRKTKASTKGFSAVGAPGVPTVDASFSYARLGGGPRVYRGFRSRGQRLSFNSLLSYRAKVGVGEQAVTVLPSWACQQQVSAGTAPNNAYLEGQGYGITSHLLAFMQLNLRRQLSMTNFQYATFGANSEAGGTLPAGIKAAKFVVHDLTLKHEIKSTTMTPIHMTLYELVLRNNIRSVTSGDSTTSWKNPQTAWEEGLKERRHPMGAEYMNVEGYLNARKAYQIPFQKPFDSTFSVGCTGYTRLRG